MTHDSHQNGYTVARLGEHAELQLDRWAIRINDQDVIAVDYPTARDFWLGRLTLAELVEMVGGGK